MSICLIAASISQTAPAPATRPIDDQEATAEYSGAIVNAKAQCDQAMRAARRAYFTAVLAADDRYIDQLNLTLSLATQQHHLATVDLLSRQMETAMDERRLHFAVASDTRVVKIANVLWYARDRTMNVTDKLKEIVAKNARNIHAWAGTFGDPWPGVPKHMLISLTVDGEPRTIAVEEDAPLPEILFPVTLSPDDPAYCEDFR